MSTVKDLYTAWWVDLPKAQCDGIEADVDANVNRFACFGAPEWGCDVCLKNDDCNEIFSDLTGAVAIVEEQ